jgi:hypothetical protein
MALSGLRAQRGAVEGATLPQGGAETALLILKTPGTSLSSAIPDMAAAIYVIIRFIARSGRERPLMPHTCHSPRLVSLLPLIRKAALHAIRDGRQNERRLIVLGPVDKLVADKRDALIRRRAPKALPVR